jgi:PAS domain S-box-containing protein
LVTSSRVDLELCAALLDRAPDALLVVDPDGAIVLASAQVRSLLGYEPADLEGRPFDVLVPERLRAIHAAHVRAYWRAPSARPMGVGLELVARRKDGSELPVEISLGPVGAQVLVAIRDDTARRAMERALRESEELNRLLVNNINDHALFKVDATGRISSWNSGAERLKGWRADEVIGRSHHCLYTPEDVAAGTPEAILRTAAERGAFLCEGARMRKDGSCFWASVLTTALRDERGTLCGFAKLVHDLTESRSVHQERDDALRWMGALVGAAPIGLVLIRGEHGGQVSANTAAQKMFGRPLGPDEGAQYMNQIRTAGVPVPDPEQSPAARALRGEVVEPEELTVVRQDGASTPVLASASPVLDEAGRPIGAVLALVDIAQLKRLQRLRDEWTTIVAHDLRQPLFTISACASRVALGDAEAKSASIIQRQVRRLDRMIRDLLDLSRIDASELTVERELLDVVSVVRDSAEQVASARGRDVRVHVRGPVPLVEADHERVSQILDNLLGNAVRYGDPGTAIDVDVVPEPPREVAISVTNHGPGIEPRAMGHLFERFERGRSSVSKRESLGLGLYITKGLVEAQGGHIDVESTPGDTTTFRFTLPARSAA